MSNELVSVILPIYNVELYLKKCGMLGPYLIISDMYRKIKSKLLDEYN